MAQNPYKKKTEQYHGTPGPITQLQKLSTHDQLYCINILILPSLF